MDFAAAQAGHSEKSPELHVDTRIAALQQELRAKEEYLQSTHEELETSNEELKSSNEEMQSVNEELQSTNEELETAKEEMQSVNEELATVNAELQGKVLDLSRRAYPNICVKGFGADLSTAEGVACDERPTRWASRVHVTPAR
jgi:predicted  nucleic acid-binding Zn-ribbon protein